MAHAFYVGDWLVEADQNRIARGGERIRLDPKWIELLTYLSERPDEILTKDAIIASVWDGMSVSDEVLTTAVYELRKALGDDAREPRYIKTIPRKGYRLIAAVEEAPVDRGKQNGLNPYPGLSPYFEKDAPFFFGREEEVEDIWGKLLRCRLLAIAGPPGAGKSSFVRAGVIPASPPRWKILVLRLDHPPLSTLARALGVEVAEPDVVIDALSNWRQSHAEGLVVLDEFERLFKESDEEPRRRFVGLLTRITEEADVHVLLSMQDDFLMQCHRYRGLKPIFHELTPLTALDREGLKRALIEPARTCSYRFEDEALVEEILAEEARGGAEQVSVIAAEIWRERDPVKRCLTRKAYHAAAERIRSGAEREGRSEKQSFQKKLSPPAGPRRKRRFARWAVAAASLAVAFVAGREFTAVTTSRDALVSPLHHRLTFRRGMVWRARFAPDGASVLYSATWHGEGNRLYSTRLGSPESRPLGYDDTDILAVSPSGELAVALNATHRRGLVLGTLAVMPVDGAAPRPLLQNVRAADWAREGGELAVLHVVDGRDRVEYPIGNLIHETADPLIEDFRVSPRGDLVAFNEGGSIRVVDRAGTSRILTTSWRGFKRLAWSHDGEEIWFTAAHSGYMPSTYAVTLEGETRLVAWGNGIEDVAPSGDALFRRFAQHKGITFVDTTERIERDLSWLDWAHMADISDDGRRILFTEAGEGGGLGLSAYLRPTDGGPAVRLGDGLARALSPDGREALVVRFAGTRVQFLSVPTGTGAEQLLLESELVPETRARTQYGGRWLADGRHLVLFTSEPGEGPRSYLVSLDGTPPRLVTRQPVVGKLVTPDGKWLLAQGRDGNARLYSLSGDESRSFPGLEIGDTPVEWSRDGRYLFVRKDWGDDPNVVSVHRVEVATGARNVVREYVPDPIRVPDVLPLAMTADARFFAYTHARGQSELYLVEGLR